MRRAALDLAIAAGLVGVVCFNEAVPEALRITGGGIAAFLVGAAIADAWDSRPR